MSGYRTLLILLAAAAYPASFAPGQGYAPEEAIAKMTVAEGLQPTLFAHEPDVRQAIFVKCDDRGRLWTIQYLQYPNPAGLKRVKVDRWSRTVYDRVPLPPPHGPRGADRITICEDRDGDGRAEHFQDFVDGLNLATGVAFGHGGVWVLNVPYLLFYPDRNRDDVPDSDPEVVLKGFGMEDAQSMSNHLTWGPDGWLYGVNGSTTTCNIRGIEFQSGVWRYQPTTDTFELFSEGGYNCYGVTFDQNGELLVSTNGGPFLHAMQGAYYYKSFGKHGPLHNLYAYHHFPILECDQVPGGPPTGGTIYRNGALPEKYHGAFMAGNFLGHTASWWKVVPQGSTFRAAYGDVLLDSHDTWFGPTDLCVGPDGALYVSDFHDQRTAHPDPDANWDLSNGRIYKIAAEGKRPPADFDVRTQSSRQLVKNLYQKNGWLRDRSRIELASRRDPTVADALAEMARNQEDAQLALEGLWGLNAIGRFDEALAIDLLNHPYPYVRYWVVRLLGDRGSVTPEVRERLGRLAADESSPPVVAQLACSARRLPPGDAIPLIDRLLDSPLAVADERIPWLLWWAIEEHADAARAELTAILADKQSGKSTPRRENALRLIRRWTAQGTAASYDAALAMLRTIARDDRESALRALSQGLSERARGLHGIGQGGLFDAQAAEDDAPEVATRSFEPLTSALRGHIQQVWHAAPEDRLALELAVRGNVEGADQALLESVRTLPDESAALVARLELLKEVGDTRATEAALDRLKPSQPQALAVLAVVDAHGTIQQIMPLVDRYDEFNAEVKSRLRDLFFGRAATAERFLERVDRGEIAAEETPVSQLAPLAAHENERIDELVRRNWGQVGRGSSEEILATMRRLSNDLRAGTGDLERGKALFGKHCGICHQLHGEGNKIGPDLTTANRTDRAALLENIVNPNAVIRREYTSYVVQTDSGRALTGMLADENAASVTLLDAQNRRVEVPREEIEAIYPADVSLMPERLLDPLSPQDLRDLFRYLENGTQ